MNVNGGRYKTLAAEFENFDGAHLAGLEERQFINLAGRKGAGAYIFQEMKKLT